MLPELADLVDQMLAADPIQRPTIARVHATLMGILPAAEATRRPMTTGALRGKGLRGTGVSSTTPAAPAPAPRPTGRLVGKLISKLTDRDGR